MLAFLWEYEGSYVSSVDAFCFLLITNGHDLYDYVRRKYVKSLKEIGKIDVFTKLNFLKEHNFGIFSREEDEVLRNKIAHHDFIIDASGKVQINGVVKDVGSSFDGLCLFTKKVFEVFCSCLDEC